SIDERPAIVDKRSRIGDFEIDTVIGKNHKQALVTIVDRYSKLTLIKKVTHKRAELVRSAAARLLAPIAHWVHTVTADNGKECAEHETLSEAVKADVYFAHPYASWERGTNENTNGLIRQYFPKGTRFEEITDEQIKAVQEKLNRRPRKTLGFKTPYEVFFGKIFEELAA
ncbi:MAG TPA: IS30 family transposase, partial [Sulfuricurvum sp.]|nr:IS30 family transposase [Sulfuricurvum sp.]